MKCPKCGFNSFEYYDSCSKCSSDLTGYKQTYSISSMVFPQEVREQLGAEFRSTESSADEVSESAEAHDDIFSFDLPEEGESAPSRNDDPFNFDEPAAETGSVSSAKSEDDIFADLLESTSQTEDSPFGVPPAAASPAPVKAPDASSGPGEFDLENFSWDDTPAASSTSESAPPADDFDSLFGDTQEQTKK